MKLTKSAIVRDLKGPQTSKPGLLRTLLSSDGIYPWKWNCSAKVQEQTKICLQKWNESPLEPRSQRHCPSSCCSSDTDWARRKCSMTVGTSNSCTYLQIYCFQKIHETVLNHVLFTPEKIWQLFLTLNGSFEVCLNKCPFSSASIDMALLCFAAPQSLPVFVLLTRLKQAPLQLECHEAKPRSAPWGTMSIESIRLSSLSHRLMAMVQLESLFL